MIQVSSIRTYGSRMQHPMFTLFWKASHVCCFDKLGERKKPQDSELSEKTSGLPYFTFRPVWLFK